MAKRAVIVGASSGMGYELAKLLLAQGYAIGVAARREDKLKSLQAISPGMVVTAAIDVTRDDAPARLLALIERLGGMELYVHVAGIGHQNMQLEPDVELSTVATNGMGFTRMVGEAYRYMARQGGGHIAVVSSIAGTKGLGAAPSYSATKAFQNVYIEALEQQARMRGLGITFTDARPGFVRTDLLNDGKRYPMLMDKRAVARAIARAIARRKRVVVIDWRYRLLVAAWRMVPSWLWARLPIKN